MINGLIGRKMGMTSVYTEDGSRIPVTLIEVGPCTVVQVKKSDSRDGYDAVQIGYQPVKMDKLTKPMQGHFRKAGFKEGFSILREMRADKPDELEPGTVVTADQIFKEQSKVKVTGTSIGKGFAGAMKRYGFKGAPASHGASKVHRRPMSAGATDAARVFKGKRSPGHMGNRRVTVKNLEIVRIKPLDGPAPEQAEPKDQEKEQKEQKTAAATRYIIAIKGSVPGKPRSLVIVSNT